MRVPADLQAAWRSSISLFLDKPCEAGLLPGLGAGFCHTLLLFLFLPSSPEGLACPQTPQGSLIKETEQSLSNPTPLT